ncbi:dienelactone hydrolase family protein [Streptomyces sp. SID10853]|uniref:dienelactone hydrolase family protein n=1 Tax=Streptomyces sp. SID10853 TaxID=2706028 RepID=UPI0013BF3722|nr:dienelactone hydrolase family protein [Streptomyces sp. SID10853]NDZ78154.1 dienelactone hydrolase family protein [Streptomyces sp. SID10853]
MTALVSRDIDYTHDGTRMIGHLCAPAGSESLPGVLLIHDAFGLSDDMIATARRIAEDGYAVFAADLWGERRLPLAESEIGPLIESLAGDRARWMARVAAARGAAAAQPEFDGSAIAVLGYCFGGSTALEYVRTGGAVHGAVSIHGGLDLIEFDWSAPAPAASVLVCTGADDPMAPAEALTRLTDAMSAAGVDWEVDLYGNTKHAFTNPKAAHSPTPEVIAYNPRSAARARESSMRFLGGLIPGPRPATS